MRWICKTALKALLLAIPFGWFLLAVAILPQCTFLELLLVLSALAAAPPAMQLVGRALWPLMSDAEKEMYKR